MSSASSSAAGEAQGSKESLEDRYEAQLSLITIVGLRKGIEFTKRSATAEDQKVLEKVAEKLFANLCCGLRREQLLIVERQVEDLLRDTREFTNKLTGLIENAAGKEYHVSLSASKDDKQPGTLISTPSKRASHPRPVNCGVSKRAFQPRPVNSGATGAGCRRRQQLRLSHLKFEELCKELFF